MSAPFRNIFPAKTILIFCCILLASSAALASINGAIQTTTSTDTVVNGNIYSSKGDVYLTGGPQNQKSSGLVPSDDTYYFQVTDPSGSILLSKDDISCREVTVAGGKITGVPAITPASCTTGLHNLGTTNGANGETPVQLCNPNSAQCPTDFADTPNPGGEYKVWVTPIEDYVGPTGSCPTGTNHFGFCDSNTKTDNFKVKQPGVAFVVVCKFNDLNGNGVQDSGEPFIPDWPITATGVDSDTGTLDTTVTAQTDSSGCVSFSISDIASGKTRTVTLTEGTLGVDWTQTAPGNGTYDSNGNSAGSGPTTVSGASPSSGVPASGGSISVVLNPGDTVTAPNFGNTNPNCATATACGGDKLMVTKTANPGNKFTWGISKSVDHTEIDTSGVSATFKYTVSVTHDSGTGWAVTGTITVSNPTPADITANVSDAVDNGGTCTITDNLGGVGELIEAGESVAVPYSCTYPSGPMPASGTNTATATWSGGSSTGTAPVDFTNAVIDGSVSVTDTLGGTLGTVSYTDPSPKTFTYSNTVTGVSGSCVTVDNTATFTTNTTGTTGTSSQTVKECTGADLTVTKTATPSFTRTYTWSITKSASPTLIEQIGGGTANVTFTVNAGEVGFTDSAWQVNGTITVANPNNWESVTLTGVTDAIDNGGTCTVGSGSLVILASSSATYSYSCTYSAAPSPASFTNTATGSWSASAASTPDGSASGKATGSFGSPTTTINKTITITDAFLGTTTTLGTCTASDSTPYASCTFTDVRTVTVPTNNCVTDTNTATISQTGQSANASVELCGPAKTGALTMGYWQNKNGQGIISGANQSSLGTWLRGYHPFSDAPSSGLASYVYNIIKMATCTSTAKTCNTMLRAQMLATALDVYFSDPSLGGNKIGAPAPIGGVKIDLTKICKMIDGSGGTASCSGSFENVSSAFGGATSMTVTSMLLYQNTADPLADAGAAWYGQVKATQVLAKDAFDAINNQVAFAP
jgi:hypothetical protein